MARTHRDLHTWTLANQLRQRIYDFTSKPHVLKDGDYCRQVRKAINSVCNNTSEGFYKFKHRAFATALRIARGEIGEVSDQLEAARDAGYLDSAEYEEFNDLCEQALKTNGGLLSYLEGRSHKGRQKPDAPKTPPAIKPESTEKPRRPNRKGP